MGLYRILNNVFSSAHNQKPHILNDSAMNDHDRKYIVWSPEHQQLNLRGVESKKNHRLCRNYHRIRIHRDMALESALIIKFENYTVNGKTHIPS